MVKQNKSMADQAAELWIMQKAIGAGLFVLTVALLFTWLAWREMTAQTLSVQDVQLQWKHELVYQRKYQFGETTSWIKEDSVLLSGVYPEQRQTPKQPEEWHPDTVTTRIVYQASYSAISTTLEGTYTSSILTDKGYQQLAADIASGCQLEITVFKDKTTMIPQCDE